MRLFLMGVGRRGAGAEGGPADGCQGGDGQGVLEPGTPWMISSLMRLMRIVSC